MRSLRQLLWRTTYVTSALLCASLGLGAVLWLPGSLSGSSAPGSSIPVGEASDETSAEVIPNSPITRPVNILVMGIDEVPDTEPGSPESFLGRSDTMLLLRLEPKDKAVAVLSIPRDTQIEIPSYGLTKINHANWMGGPSLARDVVQHNLNGMEVDRYLRVNTGAFRAMVDAVGGVRVFVPKPMQYTDETQGLEIDLEEGWQTLDGDEAEQFARFRNDEYGDIGRVQRQQVLLKALRQRITNPTIVARVPQLLEIFQDYVDTNLSSEEMVALVRFGLQLDSADLEMVMLPGRASELGEFDASYWLMDEAKRDQLLEDYFEVGPIAKARPWEDYERWDDVAQARSPYEVRIAVQNASDRGDQAQHMADYLRELGFTYVYVTSDWPDINRETEIIVQQGDREAAALIQRRLDIGELESASTGDLESEITVRVGSDWESPYW